MKRFVDLSVSLIIVVLLLPLFLAIGVLVLVNLGVPVLFSQNRPGREEKLFNTNVSWEPLLSIRAAKRKLKIASIPGDEPARIGGERKLQIWAWGACFLYEVIREKFVWK